jgi:hypothetical protein
MTPIDTGSRTLAALRWLDAAPPRPLTEHQAARADATLAAILATDPDADPGRRAADPTRRRAGRRWAVLAGVAATGLLAYSVIPGSPGAPDPAFATWKAVPDRLTPDQAGDAARYCREHGADHTDAATRAAARASTVAFAERRGVWTYVLLAGPDGFGISCLTDTTFDEGSIGSAGTPTGYRPPGPRELRLANCCGGGGTIRNGVRDFIGEVDGYAGPEVAKIVVLTPTKGPVEATIGDGRFAAWWPDDDSDTRPQAPMTFEVTLTDSSTYQVTLGP